jgi:hypothetical protein
VITIKCDFQPAMRYLANVQKQAQFAASRALNATAKAVQKAEEEEVGRVFDRPVPFTRRAFAVAYSTKQNLTAAVSIKPAQARYLAHQIEGGRRQRKRFEERLAGDTKADTGYFVPGKGVRLTAAGNLSRAQIMAIVTKLRARGQDVFAGTVRGTFGVWQRQRRTRALKALLVQIPAPSYRKRFDFYGVGRRVIEREWSRQFDIALAQALATAR